jgi:hypothetical protein
MKPSVLNGPKQLNPPEVAPFYRAAKPIRLPMRRLRVLSGDFQSAPGMGAHAYCRWPFSEWPTVRRVTKPALFPERVSGQPGWFTFVLGPFPPAIAWLELVAEDTGLPDDVLSHPYKVVIDQSILKQTSRPPCWPGLEDSRLGAEISRPH